MRYAGLLLLGLVLWTLVGCAGTLLSAGRGEVRRARRGAWWLAGVWAAYLAVLLGVSLWQPERRLVPGAEQCFGEVCFAVAGVEEVQGFPVRGEDRERLVRVGIRMSNRDRSSAQSATIAAVYLVDGQGRRWEEVRGLSGVRLTTRLTPGETAVSEPVFRVGRDATDLGLVLSRGRWQPGVLVIGDPDSWRHRPTLLLLGR